VTQRAIAVWFLLLIIAFTAGALRAALLEPRFGEPAAHVVGTLLVVVLFAAVIWRTVRWIDPTLGRRHLILVGLGWTLATVLFEFVVGHYVLSHTWSRLLADYNIADGRVWILVLLTLCLSPAVAGEIQR
jgi:hypothetical protein